jgi:hypothetical protein
MNPPTPSCPPAWWRPWSRGSGTSCSRSRDLTQSRRASERLNRFFIAHFKKCFKVGYVCIFLSCKTKILCILFSCQGVKAGFPWVNAIEIHSVQYNPKNMGLKGQCYEIFDFRFFSWISFPQPQSIPLGPFRIFSKIRGDIRSLRCTTGVVDTGGIIRGLGEDDSRRKPEAKHLVTLPL